MTLNDYATAVCNKLGNAYSLFTTRAIEVLPEAIRQTLNSGIFDRTDLYWDESNQCGAKTFEYVIKADPQKIKINQLFTDKNSDDLILWKDSPIIMFDQTYIGGTHHQIFASPVSKSQIYNTTMYAELFDDGIKAVYYHIDSSSIIVANPMPVELTGKTQIMAVLITNTFLGTTTNVLDNIFSIGLIQQFIEMAVKLLTPEK